MLADPSVHWFVAQVLAAIAAYLLGRHVGRDSPSWGEVALLCVTILTIGWAVRDMAQGAMLRLAPLDFLVYTEGTLIVPPFMLIAGVIAGMAERSPRRLSGALLGAFGLAYLGMNGAWMVTPRVVVEHDRPVLLSGGVVAQTRSDTCVAASLATALRAPGINVNATEAQMARLADVRAGRGSTMLRALRAARVRLASAAAGVEATLVNCSAAEAVGASSTRSPALVTVRSGLSRNHMVALMGRTGDGRALIANSWCGSELGAADGLPLGYATMPLEEFARIYNGAAIVFSSKRSGPGLARRPFIASAAHAAPAPVGEPVCAEPPEAAPSETHPAPDETADAPAGDDSGV